jgi:hypothetical protein
MVIIDRIAGAIASRILDFMDALLREISRLVQLAAGPPGKSRKKQERLGKKRGKSGEMPVELTDFIPFTGL